MLQYDLNALGWQIIILVLFFGILIYLRSENEKDRINKKVQDEIERTTSDVRRNTIQLSARVDSQGCEIQRISDIVNSLRGIDTRKDVDRLKELFEELREDSLKTSDKLADHQQDITALKTNKALS